MVDPLAQVSSIIRRPIRAVSVMLLLATLVACSAESPSNPLLDLLHARDFAALDAKLGSLQRRFERSEVSEVSELELRSAYRAFYNVDRDGVDALNEWIRMRPQSYPAHLIRGMGFRIAGMSARGTGTPPKTGSERSKAQSSNFQVADSELMQSLTLTGKPLLSIYYLLDISGIDCDHERSAELLETGLRISPSSALIRNRFIWYLKPRWSGSYAAMSAFIDRARNEGLPDSNVLQLEAIMEDDIGLSLFEKDRKTEATLHFAKALELAKRVGGSFQSEWVINAHFYRCKIADLKAYCQ